MWRQGLHISIFHAAKREERHAALAPLVGQHSAWLGWCSRQMLGVTRCQASGEPVPWRAPWALDDGVHGCFYLGTRESPRLQFGCRLGSKTCVPSWHRLIVRNEYAKPRSFFSRLRDLKYMYKSLCLPCLHYIFCLLDNHRLKLLLHPSLSRTDRIIRLYDAFIRCRRPFAPPTFVQTQKWKSPRRVSLLFCGVGRLKLPVHPIYSSTIMPITPTTSIRWVNGPAVSSSTLLRVPHELTSE